ncbi:MAG: sulfatase-like hydrolase/transferase [Planctomycetota bacterium]
MTQPPNILFIMSDQHRADVMGIEGRTDVPTPHLDGLARGGARFKRAYCNNAICGASRNSMQTGTLPRTLGVATFEPIGYRGDVVPIQAWLGRHGYATGAFGKRHLDPRADVGWDATASTLQRESSSREGWWSWIERRGLTEPAERDWRAEHGREKAEPMGCLVSDLPDDATMEAWTADRTLDFIRDSQARRRPFFAFCSFYRPHQPYTPTRSWHDRIDPERIELPTSLSQPPDDLPPWLADIRRRHAFPWCCGAAAESPELYRFYIRCYLALVAEIDHHIGRLLRELDTLGLADNTIVVYTADHGDFVAYHGMVEKAAVGHNVYEDTLRVPMIFRWPGRIQPGERHDLAQLADLYPTLCDLANLPTPDAQPLQGLALGDCLRAGAPVGRGYVVSENGSQSTVIERRYKLGRWAHPLNPAWDFREAPGLFFDRETDPLEIENRIDDPTVSEHVERLSARLNHHLLTTPDDAWQRVAAAAAST